MLWALLPDWLRRLFDRRPKLPTESTEDLERLLTAVARSVTQEGGKDPEVNAEKWLRMDKNGQ